MSDTAGNGTILPPQRQFVASSDGLMAWSATFDRITVVPVHPEGRQITITVGDRPVFDRVLSSQEAVHLAALLAG